MIIFTSDTFKYILMLTRYTLTQVRVWKQDFYNPFILVLLTIGYWDYNDLDEWEHTDMSRREPKISKPLARLAWVISSLRTLY